MGFKKKINVCVCICIYIYIIQSVCIFSSILGFELVTAFWLKQVAENNRKKIVIIPELS